MYWYESSLDTQNPVISSRVRFARNLEKVPFPAALSPQGKKRVFEQVKLALADRKILCVDFEHAGEVLQQTYVQTHLASAALTKSPGGGLILSDDGEISIMIHEEDHIRLQAIEGGSKIRRAYEKATEWAALLEEKLPLAYDERLGYLTACPTNLGAAMRASVMIHLPCLHAGGKINALVRALGDAGFTVRGMFGEGSRAEGAIYQISNQMSREASPEEIISSFEKVIDEVIRQEKKAREALWSHDRLQTEDSIYRAIGTLQYARKMSFAEFISLYSLIRLGQEAGMEEAKKLANPDRLLIEMMPAPLVMKNAALSTPAARDQARAEAIRSQFSGKKE